MRSPCGGSSSTPGGARGIDQVSAESALSAGGSVRLYLPWRSYERRWVDSMRERCGERVVIACDEPRPGWFESVDAVHPNPSALTSAARRMHARNYGIVSDRARCVVAVPQPGDDPGGTGQRKSRAEVQRKSILDFLSGMRIARLLGVPLYDLTRPEIERDMRRFVEVTRLECAEM